MDRLLAASRSSLSTLDRQSEGIILQIGEAGAEDSLARQARGTRLTRLT